MKKILLILPLLIFYFSLSVFGEAEKPAPKNKNATVKKTETPKKVKKTTNSEELKIELAKVTPFSQKIKAIPTGFGRYQWNVVSLFGIFILLGLAFLVSMHKKKIDYRLVCWGIGLQMMFAILILHTYPGRMVFEKARGAVDKVISFTNQGSDFVLGFLSNRGVMNETIQNRGNVHVDSKGTAYINGKKLTNREFAIFLQKKLAKLKNPKERAKITPKSWPITWEKDWNKAKKGEKSKIVVPASLANLSVKEMNYDTAYQYSQWKTASAYPAKGFTFTFQILTTIIFFASFMAVLYHLGIMQVIVFGMAKVMAKTMGTSGAESLSVAANVFVGQTEAPLVVKPYVDKMTTSELMTLMAGGFATIAGGVLVAYAAFGISAGHLLAASVMSAPAAIVMAKIMVPETEHSHTAGVIDFTIEKEAVNVIDAAATGASDGVQLAINVAAMLLAFVALIAMIDAGFSWIHSYIFYFPSSLTALFGYLFSPVAFAMGVPWNDCFKFANLIGTKLVLTEFIAYLHLMSAMPASLVEGGNFLSTRAVMLGTYALCGFANFGSIAIQLGGIGGIAPSRRHDLAKLGIRAMFAGALASFMTATIAGLLLTPKETNWRYARTLANKQIQEHVGKHEPFMLSDFAKPYYQYSALYPKEDVQAVQEEIQHYLKKIFLSYSNNPENGSLEAYRFGRIFQKRYPSFAKEVKVSLDELGKENKKVVTFTNDLGKRF